MASIGIDIGHSKLIAALVIHENELSGQPKIFRYRYIDVFEKYEKYFEKLRNENLRNKVHNLKQSIGEDLHYEAQIEKLNSVKDVNQYYENRKENVLQEDVSQYLCQYNTEYTHLLALILRSILKEVEKEFNVKDINAVISIPSLFAHFQRSAVIKAAEYAGFTDTKLINDTSAVALHYYFEKCEVNQSTNLLIYSFGASHLDVSYVSCTTDKVSVLQTWNSTKVSGNGLDNILFNEFKIKHATALKNQGDVLRKLRNKCEEVKKLLQTKEEAIIDLYLEESDKKLLLPVTANYFHDSLLSEYFSQVNEINESKSFADKRGEKYEIIIAGGSSKLKKFREQFESFIEVDDEGVAKGAAIFAVNCWKKDFSLEEMSTHRIHINCFDDKLPLVEFAQCNQRLPIHSKNVLSLFRNSMHSANLLTSGVNRVIRLMFSRDEYHPHVEGNKLNFEVDYSIDTNGCMKINLLHCRETKENYVCNIYTSTDSFEAEKYRRFINTLDEAMKQEENYNSKIVTFLAGKIETAQKIKIIENEPEYKCISEMYAEILKHTENYGNVTFKQLDAIDSNIEEFNKKLNNVYLRVECEIAQQKDCLAKTIKDVHDDISSFETYGNEDIDSLMKNLTLTIEYATNQLQGRESLNSLKESEKQLIEKKKFLDNLIKKTERKLNKPKLQNKFESTMVGQKGAISLVALTVLRKITGWMDKNRPLSFLFLGSSGIGKTHLAKEIANYLHSGNIEDGFIRIDMSEYHMKEDAARFTGSPPGFKNHEAGGQLTSALAKCPNAVVLFDEVEKAHTDVLTPLLQLFDEGRLTDGRGVTTHCKEAVFIMTSNLGSEAILKEFDSMITKHKESGGREDNFDFDDYCSLDDLREKFTPILKEHFKREEFLGRINEFVYFFPFSHKEKKILAKSELNKIRALAKENNKLTLSWEEKVVDIIADGFNKRYGARSLQNEVNREVGNSLALAQEAKEIKSGDCVKLLATKHSQYKLKLLINHEKYYRCGISIPASENDREKNGCKCQKENKK